MKRPAIIRMPLALACALILSGCGNSSSEEGKVKAVVQQYVVTSAIDCADNTSLAFDVCSSLLQKAIALHDKTSTTYPKLSECEKAQGAGRCNRVGEKMYRPRIAAFQITMSQNPVAEPLYPTKNTAAGFRTASNTEISSEAETYTFTKSAADATHLFAGKKKWP